MEELQWGRLMTDSGQGHCKMADTVLQVLAFFTNTNKG